LYLLQVSSTSNQEATEINMSRSIGRTFYLSIKTCLTNIRGGLLIIWACPTIISPSCIMMNGKPTIVAIGNENMEFGTPNNLLSTRDAVEINALYNCRSE
ncbi:unnamed protein product, partial [Porites evermanni]